jgi:galactose mutarotase-like enzyme
MRFQIGRQQDIEGGIKMGIHHPGKTGCRVSEGILGRGLKAVIMENDLMAVTILPDKGAEISALYYKSKDINVLWKAPWKVKEPGIGNLVSPDSATVWLEHYGGGWQEIFPNAGDECTYKGVRLNFHGEASLLPWSYEVIEQSSHRVSVRFSVTLFRSPFTLIRTMSLEHDRAILKLDEIVTNEANESMEFIWGHHPAFGAPFLSDACIVDTGASSIQADDRYNAPGNFLQPGEEWRWPIVQDIQGNLRDVSHIPSPQSRASCLAYLKDFSTGWYAITNRRLGLGIGLSWPIEIFPYAFFWEEVHDSTGFPFYGRAYTVAIEPFSSIPGQGLANVMHKTRSQLRLEPGGEIGVEMRVVFYEGSAGVKNIDSEGKVETNSA